MKSSNLYTVEELKYKWYLDEDYNFSTVTEVELYSMVYRELEVYKATLANELGSLARLFLTSGVELPNNIKVSTQGFTSIVIDGVEHYIKVDTRDIQVLCENFLLQRLMV